MTNGKRTCKILKEIRQQIADKNNIEYLTSECHFQGECQGSCPKCEEELQYLENELFQRRKLGKAVAIVGISIGILGTVSDCKTQQQAHVNIHQSDTIFTNEFIVYKQAQAAGTGTLKGQVVEDDGKTPIEFATVRILQNKEMVLGAISDGQGRFTLKPVPSGKYDLIVSYVGTPDRIIKDVEIEEGTVKDIGLVRMKSDSPPLTGIVIREKR